MSDRLEFGFGNKAKFVPIEGIIVNWTVWVIMMNLNRLSNHWHKENMHSLNICICWCYDVPYLQCVQLHRFSHTNAIFVC
jgi:hypothetical protein